MASKLYLKIGEVPSNIFVDDVFQIPIFLVDDADKLNCPVSQFNRVTVKVQLEELGTVLPASLLEVDQSSCIIRPQGTGQITMTFRNVSMNFENRRFVISITMANDVREVVGASTSPIFVISQQLVILEEFSAPYTWYKDEGGKDKYIEYTVFMVDRLGNHVRDKTVALKVTLMYRNGLRVPQQSIMTISPDSKLSLDRTGQTIVRIRINEVSTRHQGQYFQVLIGPDIATGPSTADVCSVLSTPIDVKSKRNHHKERDKDRGERDLLGKLASSTSSSNFRDTSDGEMLSSSKRMKLEGAASLTAAAGFLERDSKLGSNGAVCMHDHSNPAELANCTCHHKLLVPPIPSGSLIGANLHSGSSIPYRKPANVPIAIANVVLWAKTVLAAMDAIQWKQLGYASYPDGSPDPDRPLFNIPNPHESISVVVQEYAGHVKESLHVLGSMADSEMPTLPIVFNAEDEKADTVGDGNMVSLLDLWGSEDLMGMPNLMRGISTSRMNFGMDKPNLNRNHSLFLDSELPTQVIESKTGIVYPVVELGPPLEASPSDVSELEETTVHYILAEMVPELGLPAFDKNKDLIGFYKDGMKHGNTSTPIFTPISKVEHHPALHSTSFVGAVDKYLATNSSALLQRSNFGNDIRRMREDALIHFMIHTSHSTDNIIPQIH